VSVGSSLSWRALRVTAGCEAQEKAEGHPFHPGATGEGKAGRVNVVNLRMLRYQQLREVEGSSGV
jgi:hypothetical protein